MSDFVFPDIREIHMTCLRPLATSPIHAPYRVIEQGLHQSKHVFVNKLCPGQLLKVDKKVDWPPGHPLLIAPLCEYYVYVSYLTKN